MCRPFSILFIISMTLPSSFSFFCQSSYASEHLPVIRFAAGLLNIGIFPKSDAYTSDDNIIITAHDGIALTANIFVPTRLTAPAPSIIFINSWGLNEYEYLQQAAELAKKGYLVLSYTTRGFGESGGVVDTAGPNDINDLQQVIDYLLANYPADPSAIGCAAMKRNHQALS